METVSLDGSFHEFESVDDHDEDCSDENSDEIDELKKENLGLKERIERYEAELMQLVERCNKCPQCSISLQSYTHEAPSMWIHFVFVLTNRLLPCARPSA